MRAMRENVFVNTLLSWLTETVVYGWLFDKRKLISTGIIFAISGCAFDSTFFPMDDRPDDPLYACSELIKLESVDGMAIQHTFIKPCGEPAKATIFAFQGSGSKVSNWVKIFKPLVKDGYQIFMMDYRGFGQSEGEASHTLVLRDAYRAFEFLLARKDVQNKKLLIMGQSYGGQLAINVAAKNSSQIDALVTEGTFSAFDDIAVYSTHWTGKAFTRLIFRSPYRSVDLIKRIRVPTLIIHSEQDEVVPYDMAESLFQAAAGEKSLWKIKGKHTDALVDYPAMFVTKVNALLNF